MAKNETNPDETIIRLLALNDPKSISLVYKYYAPLLVKSVTSLLGSTEDAEDIVQDLMIAVWEKRKEMVLTGQFSNHFLRDLRNLAVL
jgi:RNA polymerase sigma-70 factor (ECF subfamily)